MESPLLSIRSTSSKRELVLSGRQGDNFRAELSGFEVSAATSVWAYTDAMGLNKLFQEIGHVNKPWQGERKWASLEGEFSISATCTTLGNVTFRITMCGSQGAPEEWRVAVGLSTEFGQLEKIAKDSDAFFNGTGT